MIYKKYLSIKIYMFIKYFKICSIYLLKHIVKEITSKKYLSPDRMFG